MRVIVVMLSYECLGDLTGTCEQCALLPSPASPKSTADQSWRLTEAVPLVSLSAILNFDELT